MRDYGSKAFSPSICQYLCSILYFITACGNCSFSRSKSKIAVHCTSSYLRDYWNLAGWLNYVLFGYNLIQHMQLIALVRFVSSRLVQPVARNQIWIWHSFISDSWCIQKLLTGLKMHLCCFDRPKTFRRSFQCQNRQLPSLGRQASLSSLCI